ncbi:MULTISPECIES: iron chaperone [unclassified Arthrobacter]|uniref:iron chaperone n=1 Tax=unclassified Arthrobacter TaxID=235627 RepID=UPI0014921CF8|nr:MULTISPECIES: DUF1801 domain-containing protein [unclassified Arthrobacter]MBE0008556.1 DUF1801 domain-containing protein [Arthrobacter sp. AET 35A]NOJ62296.1 DUF1801 domain-containing protein [Arthrobacter sp. 147(2020)]
MDSVDEALAAIKDPQRTCLQRIVAVARDAAPEAVAGTSYGMPVLKVEGKPLIGFTVSARHLSVHPFSPAVIDRLSATLDGFALSKGTVRFTPEHTLPDEAVRELVLARRAEIRGTA